MSMTFVVTGASDNVVDLLPETQPGDADNVFEFDGETRAVEVCGLQRHRAMAQSRRWSLLHQTNYHNPVLILFLLTSENNAI